MSPHLPKLESDQNSILGIMKFTTLVQTFLLYMTAFNFFQKDVVFEMNFENLPIFGRFCHAPNGKGFQTDVQFLR